MSAATAKADRAGTSPNPSPAALARLVQGRVKAALGSVFNCLALNLVVLVVCLPVITAPLALVAGTVAIDRWRTDGEDRVVREFFVALRSRHPLSTTVIAGAPVLVAAIGAEEVHYFARGGGPINWVCLGFGSAAFFLALSALGYVLLFAARNPTVPANETWAVGVRLAVRNLAATGPLFVAEIVGTTLLALLDPPLLLIGLPLLLLSLVRLTALLGLRKSGQLEDPDCDLGGPLK